MQFSKVYNLTKSKIIRRVFMPTVTTRSPKAKVTVTLSLDLVRRLDELLEAPEAASRSQLIEEALRRWLHDQAKEELERQTEEYYHSLSAAERKEDHQWSKVATHSAKHLWDK
jgi:metal-responsive CopG/Arc/MetJ family transcriptional regulator